MQSTYRKFFLNVANTFIVCINDKGPESDYIAGNISNMPLRKRANSNI